MGQVTSGEDAIEALRSELQAATSAHTNAMLVNNRYKSGGQGGVVRVLRDATVPRVSVVCGVHGTTCSPTGCPACISHTHMQIHGVFRHGSPAPLLPPPPSPYPHHVRALLHSRGRSDFFRIFSLFCTLYPPCTPPPSQRGALEPGESGAPAAAEPRRRRSTRAARRRQKGRRERSWAGLRKRSLFSVFFNSTRASSPTPRALDFCGP
jgi:hypothetical protein